VTLEVDLHDRVPLFLGHVEAHLVAEDPRVVDEDVEPAERLDRLVHHALGTAPAGAVVTVGDGLAAGGLDLLDDLLRRPSVAALAGARATQVVDHDRGALAREEQCFLSPDAAPGTRDDRDLAVEQTHCGFPCGFEVLT